MTQQQAQQPIMIESEVMKSFKNKIIESDDKLLKEFKDFLSWEIKCAKKKAELDFKYLRQLETGTDKETEQIKHDMDDTF